MAELHDLGTGLQGAGSALVEGLEWDGVGSALVEGLEWGFTDNKPLLSSVVHTRCWSQVV